MLRMLLSFAVIAMLGVSLSAAQDDTVPARTAYEALDLSTSELAVETFVSAFQAGDYAAVLWIFASDAQDIVLRTFSMFTFDRLLVTDSNNPRESVVMQDTPFMAGGIDALEHSPNMITFLFDDVMLAAEKNDAFLIDLRGEVEIGEAISTVNEDDDPVVDVITQVEGVGEVTFRMMQSVSGRWRVLAVIAPGGDPDELLWAVADSK